MSWTKLSDDFTDDCWTLSDAAFRLHVEGLCWSNRKLLDLVLEAADVRRFAKHPEAVEELLAVGWWTTAEDGTDGYVIRHHGIYQRPKESVLKVQEAAVKNGRKGGRPQREQAPRNPAANRTANPAANPARNRAAQQAVSEKGRSAGEHAPRNPAANPAVNPEGQARTGQGSKTQTSGSSG